MKKKKTSLQTTPRFGLLSEQCHDHKEQGLVSHLQCCLPEDQWLLNRKFDLPGCVNVCVLDKGAW